MTSLVGLFLRIAASRSSSSVGICSPLLSLPAARIFANVVLYGTLPFISQVPLAWAIITSLSLVMYASHSAPYTPSDMAYFSASIELSGAPHSLAPNLCATILLSHSAGFISFPACSSGFGNLLQSGWAGQLSFWHPVKSSAARNMFMCSLFIINIIEG